MGATSSWLTPCKYCGAPAHVNYLVATERGSYCMICAYAYRATIRSGCTRMESWALHAINPYLKGPGGIQDRKMANLFLDRVRRAMAA